MRDCRSSPSQTSGRLFDRGYSLGTCLVLSSSTVSGLFPSATGTENTTEAAMNRVVCSLSGNDETNGNTIFIFLCQHVDEVCLFGSKLQIVDQGAFQSSQGWTINVSKGPHVKPERCWRAEPTINCSAQ